MSAALHARLLARNVIRPFFDPSFCFPSTCTTPDEAAKVADFIPDLIEIPRIDDNGEANSLVIPFFTKFLKRKPATAVPVCEGCLESWCDIDYGSLDEWIETCRPFPGSWMWTVLPFSDMLAAKCDHNINYCTNCLPEHIKANMDMYGCYAADNIRCPSEDCERKLSYKEIQCYVDKETKERYDRLRYLKSVSQLPNFRWCSRAECQNGQTFDPEEVNEGLPVQCGECGFDMCFSHQVPWHQGMTCEEYESRRHGDPTLNETNAWMRQNTKKFPGTDCGISIEKEDGCFHMECPSCHFEFCWECLADFNLICLDEGDVWNHEAHNEGCFFRAGTLDPWDIDGSTLEQAMERMRV